MLTADRRTSNTSGDIATTAADRAQDEKYCHECGTVIRLRAEICPNCGVRQPLLPGMVGANSSGLPSGRSRLAAALFAILLGGLGIHKFYLGRVGWGVVYLLFSWTLIPIVVGFIEGIVLIGMSDTAFAEKYGH
ncbi:MAG: hypothetical protein JWL84_6092 [Rhodospirillales bacterium]|nr:hypothetical protein [Rhodospirillales bacterium]